MNPVLAGVVAFVAFLGMFSILAPNSIALPLVFYLLILSFVIGVAEWYWEKSMQRTSNDGKGRIGMTLLRRVAAFLTFAGIITIVAIMGPGSIGFGMYVALLIPALVVGLLDWGLRDNGEDITGKVMKDAFSKLSSSQRKILAIALIVIMASSIGYYAVTRPQSNIRAVIAGNHFDNLVIVAMENQNYADVMGTGTGSPNAPFVGTVLNSGHSVTYPNFHSYGAGIGGCSAGCYEALITGMQTMSDGYSCCTTRPTVVDSLGNLGGTWQAYCESGCPRGPDHFPFIAFSPTSTSSNIFTGSGVSTSTFIAAANSATPPNFLWFTPTDSHNMHDNSIQSGDSYLKSFLVGSGTVAVPASGSLLASSLFSPGHKTLLMLWWDEYDPSPQLLYSPQLITGSSIDNGNNYTEYSWLHLIEANWGLPTLTGNDASAVIPPVFGVPPPPNPDFTLSTSPSSITFQTGSLGSSTIGVSALSGFTGSVTLSVPAQTGINCVLSVTMLSPGQSTPLSCSSITIGLYNVIVNGISGPLSHSVTLQVQVTAVSPTSGNFGSCTGLPQGWNCGNAIGLSGTHATITNGVLDTTLLATGIGNDNNYQYATTQKGTFPWSPCQAPAPGVLPAGLTTVNSTFTVVSPLPVNNGRYVIYIALYYYLPNGPTTGNGVAHQCVDTQSRLENVGGAFTGVGTTSTFDPGDSFGWNVVTLGSVTSGGTYTITADATTQCTRALSAWNVPSGTPCQLAGVEIGVEGFQFNMLDVSWGAVSLAAGTPPPPPSLATSFTFAPANPIIGQTVTFTGTATGGVAPYTFSWAFGDGVTGTGAAATHAYSTSGTFTVTLTTQDAQPVTASISHSVNIPIITPPPPPASGNKFYITFQGFDFDGRGEATITMNGRFVAIRPTADTPANAGVFRGFRLNVTNFAVNGTNTVLFTHAQFDCGVNDNLRNFAVVNQTNAVFFSDPTIHIFNCSTSVTYTFNLGTTPPPPPPLIVSFTHGGLTVTFTATVSGGTPPYTYTWAFGDATTGTGNPVTHTYATAGTYTISLMVKDGAGQTVTVTQTVTV